MREQRPDLFVADAARRAEKLVEVCGKISSSGNMICRKAADIKRYSMEDPVERQMILDCAQMVENDLVRIGWFTKLVYKTVSEPNIYEGVYSYPGALLTEEQAEVRAVFEVKAVAKDGVLLVKLPTLPSKFNRRFNKKSSFGNQDYGAWATVELETELLKIEREIPVFPTRNLAYLYVLPAVNNILLPDADNHDTKGITDTVSRFVGDDNPLQCTFSHYSTQTQSLDVGTYLAVTPTFGEPPSLTTLVSLFSEYFPKDDTRQKG